MSTTERFAGLLRRCPHLKHDENFRAAAEWLYERGVVFNCRHDWSAGSCRICGEGHNCTHFVDDLCVTCGAMA